MASGVVLTRWKTDRSVHETAVRAADGTTGQAVRGYVAYEEWPASRMVRRELARCGIALALAFGDPLDVHDADEGPVRSLGAFVVGNQSRATLNRAWRPSAWSTGVRSDRTLADVAIECGYYDQSHLTRDFVALAGCTPGAFMGESNQQPTVRFLQDDGVTGSVRWPHGDETGHHQRDGGHPHPRVRGHRGRP